MSQTQLSAAVDPAALSGVRFLVAKRIEDLDAAAARLESGLADAAARRAELRDQIEHADASWRRLLAAYPSVSPDGIEAAVALLAQRRADLAVIEERYRDVGARLIDMRTEQEVLRTVDRALDDVASASGVAGETRSASRQVFAIIEEERMRIARDIHDGPAQAMANLVLQAEILERLIARDPKQVMSELADFKDDVRNILDDTRRMIFDLRPMTLDDLGLVPTLRKYVTEFGQKAHLITHLRVVGEEVRLPGSYEQTIFRIIQEALNNVRKHARAQNLEVIICFQPPQVIAIVKDDGVGFEVEAAQTRVAAAKHLGLISMRERAEQEDGHVEVRSQIGKGTEVRAEFTVETAPSAESA